MRTLTVLVIVSLCAAFMGACVVGEDKPNLENTIVVMDKASNRALSAYETGAKDQIVRTLTYGEASRVNRSRSFSYDEEGYLGRMDEQEPGKAPRTVIYTNEFIRDSQGQLQTVRTITSEGDQIESYLVYDENGILRGNALKMNETTVIMKDYGENE